MIRFEPNTQGIERIRSAARLFEVTQLDMAGPVLVRLSQEHQRQEREIFSTEGAAGGQGRWPALSPEYAARKRAAMGAGRAAARGKKGKPRTTLLRRLGRPISMRILVWSGDMRDRFLRPSRPEYVARYVETGPATGRFEFGAASDIASYHAQQRGAGGGRLPRRDMVIKTPQQMTRLRVAFLDWYRKERVPMAFRALRAFGLPGTTGRGMPLRGAAR